MRKLMAAAIVCLAVALGVGVHLPTVTAEPFGDETSQLQAMFDQMQAGDTLTLEPRTYRHGGLLYIRAPGVRVNGNGATLQATNDETSAVTIFGDNVSVTNLNLTAPLQGQRYYSIYQHKLVVAGRGDTLSDITVTGSASVGVFIAGSGFRLDRVTVRDTRADGIHMSAGASDGQVNDSTTERTGDDGFAVVSYTPALDGNTSPPCRNIVINSPVVNGTTQARGITVAGGENITIRNIKVSDTSSAGLFISNLGAPFFTQSTDNVVVSGGSITGANRDAVLFTGALAVYSEQAGYGVSNVSISGLTIADTPPIAQRVVGIEVANGGAVGNIALSDIRIRQTNDLPTLTSNASRDAYTATGVTRNGAAVEVG